MNKYFGGKRIKWGDDKYEWCYGIDDNGQHVNLEINAATKTVPVTNHVTAKPGEKISWDLGEIIKLLKTTDTPDYAALPHNTITVRARFTDGTVVTKKIELSFDKNGLLICELKDN